MNQYKLKVYPSMLSANILNFEQEIRDIVKSGADAIHWDIMDGHFVENLTFGPNFVSAAREIFKIRFDVHLMVANPENHLEKFVESGADILIVHTESTDHIHKLLSAIKKYGIKSGVAFNPGTDISVIKYLKDVIDMILIMTVNPGASGQSFIENQLEKILIARELIGPDIEICVDGGINFQTAKLCLDYGANSVVSGAYIFSNPPYCNSISALHAL